MKSLNMLFEFFNTSEFETWNQLFPLNQSHYKSSMLTYIFLKVLQAEVVGFEEKLVVVHAPGVEDDVGALRHPVALDDVIRQGSAHGEVHHWVEAQALVDEGLQHLQLVKVPLL